MADFYERMQATATRLLTKYKQGSVIFRRISITAGSNPWDASVGSSVDYTLKCAVEPVHQKYIDNSTVLSTDRQVLFSSLEIEPENTDQIIIDGKTFEIKKLMRYPSAGIPIYYTAIIGA